MRLWSLHPQYLDRRGLVALWREALLAQKVLAGNTMGYRRHPQLHRFREHPDERSAIASYLHGILDEAEARGYSFNRSKIRSSPAAAHLDVTSGQLLFEREHLLRKLRARDPEAAFHLEKIGIPRAHPAFHVVDGPPAAWERG